MNLKRTSSHQRLARSGFGSWSSNDRLTQTSALDDNASWRKMWAYKHHASGMTMEIRVKLLLQGGHGWEFCCKDDDPIVFGLVSALPGADVGGNLPPDGLVQIETRTGER